MFEGSWVALVTPFRAGELDPDALALLIEQQVEGGTDGLVVCGTTGEAPTLSADERRRLIQLVVERVKDRLPVVVGTGSYNTADAIARTREACALGAAGVLVVNPYYNRPGPRGLRAHFLALAEASTVPLILYNIPSRTACRLEPELIRELAAHPRIVALKEATGSMADAMAVMDSGLTVLAGDDAGTLAWMALGASGVVSVAANAAPAEISSLVREMQRGDLAAARLRHYRLLPLFQALFVESNPVPVKALLAQLGIGTAEVRLPLAEASHETRALLRRAWERVKEGARSQRVGTG